jgi:hypothetical protein
VHAEEKSQRDPAALYRTTTQITRWRREEEEEEFVEKGRGVAASRSIDISRTSCRKTRTLYWSF